MPDTEERGFNSVWILPSTKEKHQTRRRNEVWCKWSLLNFPQLKWMKHQKKKLHKLVQDLRLLEGSVEVLIIRTTESDGFADCNWCTGERHWKAEGNFTNPKQNVTARGPLWQHIKQLFPFTAENKKRQTILASSGSPKKVDVSTTSGQSSGGIAVTLW